MSELKSAITVVEVIAAVVAAMVVGDYLGYKIGRWRLVFGLGIIILAAVIGFAIYAAVVLS